MITSETTQEELTPPDSRTDALLLRAPLLVRISSHVAVWVTVLVSLGVELAHGWRPVGDNAAIASRAFQTLSSHPPVVGMLSTAGGTGHTVYDPGPLLFWLLAVPVRLDHTHGALWGAALLAGAVLSLAIEAVWSTRLWPGCAVIAFAVVDMFWLTPSVFENISWNAYFPIPFLIATLALAWVVGTGSFGWWPALVVTASVAAQTHLLFSIPCTLLALTAPAIGLVIAGRPRRLRWLWIGVGVAIVCWIAPILQQLFAKTGNVSALFGSQSGQPKLGVSFALTLLGRMGGPSPIWIVHQPTTYFSVVDFETAATSTGGAIILGLLVATALWGWVTRRRRLSASAGIGLVASAGIVTAFAIFPTAQGIDLYYLFNLLWPLGVLVWATLLWGLATVVVDLIRRWSGPTPRATIDANIATTLPAQWQVIAALLSVGVITIMCILGIQGLSGFTPTEATVSWDTFDVASVTNISRAIEHAVPTGTVKFSVSNGPGSITTIVWIAEGVGWQLAADGWTPGLNPVEANYTGLRVPDGTDYTAVHVTMKGSQVVALTTTHCRTGAANCGPSG